MPVPAPTEPRRARPRSWSKILAVAVVVIVVAAACSSSSDSGSDTETAATTGSAADTGGGDGDGSGDATSGGVAAAHDEGLTPVDGGTITFAVEADSDGYHPINNRWSISGNFVGSTMFEPLVAEVGDGTLEPWLAESVEPNDDGTVWTITTKEGIEFHDGTPFNAEAVAANIEARRENPLTAIANELISDVRVLDDRTVEVEMTGPWSGYGHTLAAAGGYMAAPSFIDDPTIDPVGTGPFVFEEWVPDDNLTVTRNENYWREPARLDGIEFKFLPDVLSRTASLESGAVDAILTPDPGTILDFRENDDIISYEHSSEPFHILLNTSVPPFDNPLARQALAYGTNRDTIITVLDGDGLLVPADSPFVPGNPWRLDDNGYPSYDLEKATELVAQYEEETGEKLSFTLKGSSGQEDLLSQTLLEQWGAAGIDASYKKTEQSTLIGEVVFGDYEAGLWRSHNWIDPDFNYIFWHSSTAKGAGELSINFTQIKNDDLDAALDLGRSSLDPEVRAEAYDDVQRILNQELAHIWLFNVVWAIATVPELHGFADIEERGLSRLEPKVFWADVWVEP